MDTSFRTTQKLVAPEKEPITPFIAKVRTTTLTPSRRNVFFAPFHAKTRTFAKTGSGTNTKENSKKVPITPCMNCAKVRPLADVGPEGGNGGVSSILVLGGSGDYFEVADTVIAMDA